MKKIAITQRLIMNDKYYEVREALDIRWGVLFNKLDFLPIILPIEYSFEEYFNNIEIDGILLTGGNDLNSIKENKMSRKRDVFEKNLIKYAILNDIPIFGVCRGLQIIAEYFGASFIDVKNQINIKHRLKPNKQSKYINELVQINTVNSFHSYTIENLPDTLLVSATDEDNIIKAIEHKHYKIFGQMWHSERERSFQEEELVLIREFFND